MRLNKKKILKHNFLPTQQLFQQEVPVDLENFCPDLSIPKALMPIEKYGRNNTIKPGAFDKYFHQKNSEIKGTLANKSTQKTKKGLALKSLATDSSIMKVK